MLKQIVQIIKDLALRHKGVHLFRYMGEDLINAQGNNDKVQVILDDINFSEKIITKDIVTINLEMYILDFVDTKDLDSHLEVQDECYTIAVDILTMLENNRDYSQFLDLYDWSIMTLSRYTSDNDSGVKVSIKLKVALDTCDYLSNFNEEPYEKEPSTDEREIDVIGRDSDDEKELNIKPIKLRKVK